MELDGSEEASAVVGDRGEGGGRHQVGLAELVLHLSDAGEDEAVHVTDLSSLGSEHPAQEPLGPGLAEVLRLHPVVVATQLDVDGLPVGVLSEEAPVEERGVGDVEGVLGGGVERALHVEGLVDRGVGGVVAVGVSIGLPDRLGVRRAVDPDPAVELPGGEGGDMATAALVDRPAEPGDGSAAALAIELPAMVAALDVGAADPAHGEGHVAVGAAVEDGGGLAVLPAEDGDGRAQEGDGQGRLAEGLALTGDVPVVEHLGGRGDALGGGGDEARLEGHGAGA